MTNCSFAYSNEKRRMGFKLPNENYSQIITKFFPEFCQILTSCMIVQLMYWIEFSFTYITFKITLLLMYRLNVFLKVLSSFWFVTTDVTNSIFCYIVIIVPMIHHMPFCAKRLITLIAFIGFFFTMYSMDMCLKPFEMLKNIGIMRIAVRERSLIT